MFMCSIFGGNVIYSVAEVDDVIQGPAVFCKKKTKIQDAIYYNEMWFVQSVPDSVQNLRQIKFRSISQYFII